MVLANNFITKKFGPFYQEHGEKFRKTILLGLLDNVIAYIEGKIFQRVAGISMNVFIVFDSISSRASRFRQQNIYLPTTRKLKKFKED